MVVSVVICTDRILSLINSKNKTLHWLGSSRRLSSLDLFQAEEAEETVGPLQGPGLSRIVEAGGSGHTEEVEDSPYIEVVEDSFHIEMLGGSSHTD